MPVGRWVIRTAESVVLTLCPPGPGGPEDVDADLVLRDVDVVELLDDRQHLDPGERGLPAALVVERRDAHQPVGALLDREGAVGVGLLDREGGRLDAGLLGVGDVVDLDRVLVPLGPAQVHAHEHLGEVGGVDTAGLRADGHQRLAGVVLAGQQGADLELVDLLAQRDQLALGLGQAGRVALLLGQLVQHAGVVEPAAQLLDPAQVALQVGQPGGELLGALDVVPQVGRGGLLLQLGDLARAACRRPGRPRWTSGSCRARRGHRRSQRPRRSRVVASRRPAGTGTRLRTRTLAGGLRTRAPGRLTQAWEAIVRVGRETHAWLAARGASGAVAAGAGRGARRTASAPAPRPASAGRCGSPARRCSPSSSASASWSAVSTPSARLRMPQARPRPTTAAIAAAAWLRRSPAPATRLRSILSRPAGMLTSWPSEEKPLPKSSMEISTPSTRSRANCSAARCGSSATVRLGELEQQPLRRQARRRRARRRRRPPACRRPGARR